MPAVTDSIQPDLPARREFESHQHQFDRFVHLTKWFALHLAALLVALYFFIVGGQPIAGAIFLVLSLIMLGYGIWSTSQVRRDVDAAIHHRPDPS